MVEEFEQSNNGEGSQSLIRGEAPNPFTQQEGFSSIKVLVDPGKAENLESLLMRGYIPEKHTSGYALMVNITHLCDQYTRHGYERGLQRLRNLLAGLPSLDGKRAEMVVDAIIGERQQRRAEAGSFTDKIGNIAKNGFGDKSKE